MNRRLRFDFVSLATAALLLLCASVRLPAAGLGSATSHRTSSAATSRKASAKAKAGKSARRSASHSARNGHRLARTTGQTTGKTIKGKHRRGAPIAAYHLGHGNGGVGTLTPPAVYTAPAPPVVAVSPANVPPTSLPGEILFPEHLDRFFSRLQAIETGDNQQTLRILQFGDSHTAADMFTGRLRSLLQQRFTSGGAGFTYAGHPFAGYRILGTSRGQSAGWVSEGVHFTKIVNTQLGLGGVANTSTRAGDTLDLDAPCSLLQVHYLDQPGGGSFSITEDGRPLTKVDTNNPVAPQTFETPCAAGSHDTSIHHFQLTSESSRPVRLFGTVTERPGLTYEALGLNGAEAALILRWDQPVFLNYLKESDPALIVLAYGTNEAGNHDWTYESYSALLTRLVGTLHAAVPEAAILIVGPPDRSLRVGRRRAAHWQTFARTVPISDAQRDVCRANDCAFWDWRARMGGLGSMNRWAAKGLAQPDHTHFTSTGYIQLADSFYSDMIGAYSLWKQQHNAPDLAPKPASPQGQK